MADIQQLEELLASPYAPVVLDFLADMEGTSGVGDDRGYNVAFGNTIFKDYKAHPNTTGAYTDLNGKKRTSTAAGRYQMLYPTFTAIQEQYNLPDFSPHSQDLAVMALIKEVGGTEALRTGDFPTLLNKLSRRWASIPGSTLATSKGLHGTQSLEKAYSSYLTRLNQHDPSGTTLIRPEYSGNIISGAWDRAPVAAIDPTNLPNPTPLPNLPPRPEFVAQLLNQRYASRRLAVSPDPLTPRTADALASVLMNPALANGVAFTIPQPMPDGVTAVQYPASPEYLPDTGVRIVNELYPNDILTAPYKPTFVLDPITEEQLQLGDSLSDILSISPDAEGSPDKVTSSEDYLREALVRGRMAEVPFDFLSMDTPFTQELLDLIDQTEV